MFFIFSFIMVSLLSHCMCLYHPMGVWRSILSGLKVQTEKKTPLWLELATDVFVSMMEQWLTSLLFLGIVIWCLQGGISSASPMPTHVGYGRESQAGENWRRPRPLSSHFNADTAPKWIIQIIKWNRGIYCHLWSNASQIDTEDYRETKSDNVR